jgi:hypothetical protein
MKDAPPTPSEIYALAAEMRLWLIGVAAWLADLLRTTPLERPIRRWLLVELAGAEKFGRALAVVLTGPPRTHARRTRIPRADARQRPRAALRRLTRRLMAPVRRTDFNARIARLHAFLDALDAAAATVRARLARGFRTGGFPAGIERPADRAAEACRASPQHPFAGALDSS